MGENGARRIGEFAVIWLNQQNSRGRRTMPSLKTLSVCVFEGATLLAMFAAIVAVVTILAEFMS